MLCWLRGASSPSAGQNPGPAPPLLILTHVCAVSHALHSPLRKFEPPSHTHTRYPYCHLAGAQHDRYFGGICACFTYISFLLTFQKTKKRFFFYSKIHVSEVPQPEPVALHAFEFSSPLPLSPLLPVAHEAQATARVPAVRVAGRSREEPGPCPAPGGGEV